MIYEFKIFIVHLFFLNITLYSSLDIKNKIYSFEEDLSFISLENNFYNNMKINANNINKKKYILNDSAFWKLSYYDFNSTNPSYAKRVVYDLINNKDYYKYYKLISFASLSAISYNLFIYPFYIKFENNLEKEGIRKSVDEIENKIKNSSNKTIIKENLLTDFILKEGKNSIYNFIYKFSLELLEILKKHEDTINKLLILKDNLERLPEIFSENNVKNFMEALINKYTIYSKNSSLINNFKQAYNAKELYNDFIKIKNDNQYDINTIFMWIDSLDKSNKNNNNKPNIDINNFKFIFKNWPKIQSILNDNSQLLDQYFGKSLNLSFVDLLKIVNDLFNMQNININEGENISINYKVDDFFNGSINLKVKDSIKNINIFELFKNHLFFMILDLNDKKILNNVENINEYLKDKKNFIDRLKYIAKSDKTTSIDLKSIINFILEKLGSPFELPNITIYFNQLNDQLKSTVHSLSLYNIKNKLDNYINSLRLSVNKNERKAKIKDYRVLLRNSELFKEEAWAYNKKSIVDKEISKHINYGFIYPKKKYLERSWNDKGFLFAIGAYIYNAPSLINPFKFIYNTFFNLVNHFSTENMYPGIKILSPYDFKVSKDSIGGLFLVKQIFSNLIKKLDFQSNTKKQGVGFVLHGGPGTGKTLSAELLAKELGYYMMYIDSASIVPTKESKYTIANALTYIFKKAAAMNNCILLFDEFDRLITTEEIESEILKLLDIYLKNTNMIVIATTNNLHKFSKAMIRPGRLNNVIFVDKPSYKERVDMLYKFFENNKFDQENSNLITYIANITQDFSSASIKELISNIITKTTLLKTNIVSYDMINESFFKLTLGNKYTGFDLSEKYLNNSSILMAAELYHLLKHDDSFLYNIVYATIKPYEKNYKENIDFSGFVYKVNKNELNQAKNNKSLILDIESMLIKVATEDIMFKTRSVYTKKYIEAAKELINLYISINYKYLKENEILEKSNDLYNKIYNEMLLLLKMNHNYLENIKKIAQLLKENEIISGKQVFNIIKEEKTQKL